MSIQDFRSHLQKMKSVLIVLGGDAGRVDKVFSRIPASVCKVKKRVLGEDEIVRIVKEHLTDVDDATAAKVAKDILDVIGDCAQHNATDVVKCRSRGFSIMITKDSDVPWNDIVPEGVHVVRWHINDDADVTRAVRLLSSDSD